MRLEVAYFEMAIGERYENAVNYPNPQRQRGILANTVETQNRNPLLTPWVVTVANAQLQNWRVGLVVNYSRQLDSCRSPTLVSSFTAAFHLQQKSLPFTANRLNEVAGGQQNATVGLSISGQDLASNLRWESE